MCDLPEAKGIPKDLVDLFDAAVTHHQNNTPLQQELQAALDTPFQYELFINTINKKNSREVPWHHKLLHQHDEVLARKHT
jgi:hypothetical protein